MKNFTITRNLLILLGSIGSLSMLGCNLSIDLASANPAVRTKPNYQLKFVKGQITTSQSGATNVPCSKITVQLIEATPQKPSGPPGGFATTESKKTLNEAIATGNNLASGCSYEIGYGGDGRSVQTPYGSSYFSISSRGNTPDTQNLSGGSNRLQEVPSTLNLQMEYEKLR